MESKSNAGDKSGVKLRPPATYEEYRDNVASYLREEGYAPHVAHAASVFVVVLLVLTRRGPEDPRTWEALAEAFKILDTWRRATP